MLPEERKLEKGVVFGDPCMLDGGTDAEEKGQLVTGDPKVNFFDLHRRSLAVARGTLLYMNACRCSFNTLLNKHCF